MLEKREKRRERQKLIYNDDDDEGNKIKVDPYSFNCFIEEAP